MDDQDSSGDNGKVWPTSTAPTETPNQSPSAVVNGHLDTSEGKISPSSSTHDAGNEIEEGEAIDDDYTGDHHRNHRDRRESRRRRYRTNNSSRSRERSPSRPLYRSTSSYYDRDRASDRYQNYSRRSSREYSRRRRPSPEYDQDSHYSGGRKFGYSARPHRSRYSSRSRDRRSHSPSPGSIPQDASVDIHRGSYRYTHRQQSRNYRQPSPPYQQSLTPRPNFIKLSTGVYHQSLEPFVTSQMEPLDSEYIKLESHSKQMYETGVSLRLNSHRLMCELEAADREVAHWEAQLELASEQLQQVENAIKDGVVNYISNNVDDIDTLVVG